jgi:hypothetical protein
MLVNKNQYQALLRGKVASAILQARMSAKLSHQGLKGSVLEILLSQLFRPLLPSDIGVGTGQIIEANSDRMSPQIDIVIYNKSILPPILIDSNLGLFPIESVLYTIEVKTTLTSAGIATANTSAKNIRNNFEYLPGQIDSNGKRIKHPIGKPISVVFALNTDLKKGGMTEAERYKKVYKNDDIFLSAICVAGREYSYEYDDNWVTMRNKEDFDEILSFIAGLTNTYRTVSNTRGYPLLGHYVAPDAKPNEVTISPAFDFPNIIVKCVKCEKQKSVNPTFGDQNRTIKDGILNITPPCECGGDFISEKGTFIIKNGRLRGIITS